MSEHTYTVYRVHWLDADGKHCEFDYPSRTEAEIRKLQLKREGITARILAIKTTIG